MTVAWEPSIITPQSTIGIQVRAVGHIDIDAGEFLSRFRLQYIAQFVSDSLSGPQSFARVH